MSISGRIAQYLGISPDELITSVSLLGFAIVSGLGALIIRSKTITIRSPSIDINMILLQYSLLYFLLGLLPVLLRRSIGTEGWAVSLFLMISIFVGLLIRPEIDPFNIVIALLVMLGGFAYYSVFQNATNIELLGLIITVLTEIYVFLMYYMWIVLQATGDIRLAGLTMIYLTGGIIIIGRLLWVEIQKARAGSGFQI